MDEVQQCPDECRFRERFEARISELEAALLRHGHKDDACGLCAALTSQASGEGKHGTK